MNHAHSEIVPTSYCFINMLFIYRLINFDLKCLILSEIDANILNGIFNQLEDGLYEYCYEKGFCIKKGK